MNLPNRHSYLSPKLEFREHPNFDGKGVFAKTPVQTGELLAVWSGFIVTLDQWGELPPEIQIHTAQVEEDLYLASYLPDEPADYINHSCAPNAGMCGQIALVAMRAINLGEEICFDYAMVDGSAYDEFVCECGTLECRGKVTGKDWRIQELWDKYEGYFSPYLQRRIDALRAQMALLPADRTPVLANLKQPDTDG